MKVNIELIKIKEVRECKIYYIYYTFLKCVTYIRIQCYHVEKGMNSNQIKNRLKMTSWGEKFETYYFETIFW